MKLYYSKAACSLAPHIVLEELGLKYEAIPIDLRAPIPPDYLKINPMGAVPAILMDDGQPLTEVAVILQYLADLKPEAGITAPGGSLERYRLQEALNFIATELHKGFAPLWGLEGLTQDPKAREEIRGVVTAELGNKFDVLVQKMNSQPYFVLSKYTIADAYLFTVLNWAGYLKLDLSRWPTLTAYLESIKARPGTVRALKAERMMN